MIARPSGARARGPAGSRSPERSFGPGADGPLSIEEVVPYLHQRGFLSARQVVDGRVRVADASRRNRCYRVSRAGGPGLFLKEPGPGAEPSDEGTAAEAAFLGACAEGGELSRLRDVAPRLLGFDSARRRLVAELVEPALPLWQLLDGPAAAPAAALLGAALARVHSLVPPASLPRSPLAGRAPWVLYLDRPGPEVLEVASPAQLQLVRIVQGTEGLGSLLRCLLADWRPRALVHGDVKGDNVLVVVEPGPESIGGRICLVDWELAHLGDPAWDVGGALHDFLVHWIGALRLAAGRELHQQLRDVGQPLAALRPAALALWSSYRREAGLEGQGALVFLLASVRWAGARLFQAAWEDGAEAAILSNDAVAMAQLGANLLADPQPACFGVLGIPLPALPPPLGAPGAMAARHAAPPSPAEMDP